MAAGQTKYRAEHVSRKIWERSHGNDCLQTLAAHHFRENTGVMRRRGVGYFL